MSEALENLAQVATDQLFAFDTTNFLTPQLARQVPLGSEDFVTGLDEPTNIFGEPIDFHDTSVTGTKLGPFHTLCLLRKYKYFGSRGSEWAVVDLETTFNFIYVTIKFLLFP